VLEHAGVPGWVTAADGGFHRVTGSGASAARAHRGDPQGGRMAQIVRGSSVRAAISPLRRPGTKKWRLPMRFQFAGQGIMRAWGRFHRYTVRQLP
jgi:hypothetical protein